MARKRTLLGAFPVAFALIAGVAIVPASPPPPGEQFEALRGDDMKHPLGERQRALRQQALKNRLNGGGAGRVQQLGKGQFVEMEQVKSDRIFAIIVEFGNARHESFPGGTDGPLHNQIPKPDRTTDNSTIWQRDFNRAHYEDMYFDKMARYYESQSSGRYSVEGEVTDWVLVPYNEARYGRDVCGRQICNNTWLLIHDAVNTWVKDRLAAGMKKAQIQNYLATFDVHDRYDSDGDGNFDEPDGYIDHFQIVHAGQGQEVGGGAQGNDAIWSHRWYTASQGIGVWGPPGARLGGMEFGGDGDFGNQGGSDAMGIWVGDYTIQPENGGLGVFAHEYGHDLGLPDLYDVSGNTCGASCSNSTGYWSLMSVGCYLGDGGKDGIGTKPGDLGAWEKLQLGWLDYETALPFGTADFRLGPAAGGSKQTQALIAVLPDKLVSTQLGAAYAGTYFYHSGLGDNLDNRMYQAVAVPAAGALLAQVRYQIEKDWDYAYVEVSNDGGATWIPISTNLSTTTNPNGLNLGQGITGDSAGAWVALTADLSAWAGQNVLLGFRYVTDGGTTENGFMLDDIALPGMPTDGAESDTGWTYAPAHGFARSLGTSTSQYFNAYIAEFRQYRGYDRGLKTGPLNYGFVPTLPNQVEHFPYQDGLLVWYWDSSQNDNSTSTHPGSGLILPIDAHPEPMLKPTGTLWSSEIQSYDSTFGLASTDAITLHIKGTASSHPSLAAAPTFDDRVQYWRAKTPTAGVRNPNTGLQIEVLSSNGKVMNVQVRHAH